MNIEMIRLVESNRENINRDTSISVVSSVFLSKINDKVSLLSS